MTSEHPTITRFREDHHRRGGTGQVVILPDSVHTAALAAEQGWVPLFDGRSLDGWRASEDAAAWHLEDGCLVFRGGRSHLFYDGPIADHQFRNFELEVECWTAPGCNSGVYFHTAFQQDGFPDQGYEVQINNTYVAQGNYREIRRTGSLYAVRDIAQPFVPDRRWFTIRIRVTGPRVRVHVDDHLLVDYTQPAAPYRSKGFVGRLLNSGTIGLQGHDVDSEVRFRRVAIRLLPDDADASQPERGSDEGYGVSENLLDRIFGEGLPFIDYHIHLRGGMTIDQALERQAATGFNVGVLENIGEGWPIHLDEHLRWFIGQAQGKPVYLGVQVNDRDWFTKHDRALLEQLDYVLADTMIMTMPDDQSPPVKLWMPDLYTIADPHAWMERYLRHNLQILDEPVSILANPTYLPPAVAPLYDELWTDQRMRLVIAKAVERGIALEIPARSAYPSDRFITMAKAMGAKFTFGSNNFDPVPITMQRCFEAIKTYGLTKHDCWVPEGKVRIP